MFFSKSELHQPKNQDVKFTDMVGQGKIRHDLEDIVQNTTSCNFCYSYMYLENRTLHNPRSLSTFSKMKGKLALLQKESEILIEDLFERYRQVYYESTNLPKADSPTAIQPEKESIQEEMVYADGGDNEDKINEAVEAEGGDNDDRIASSCCLIAAKHQPSFIKSLTILGGIDGEYVQITRTSETKV
ncbi:hypothetical protein Tco_0614823 [Tanacetum coccineum]